MRVVTALLLLAAALPAQGKVFMKVKDALALAFPKCKVERTSVYLKAEQKKKVAKLYARWAELEAKRQACLVG